MSLQCCSMMRDHIRQSSTDWRCTTVATCPRCQGFMVPLTAEDVDDAPFRASEQLGWRCVNCGERLDPLIVANRSATRDGTLTASRPRA